jgi:hypothetical protein
MMCGAGLVGLACTSAWAQEGLGLGPTPARSLVVEVEHAGATVTYLAQPAIVQDMVQRGMLKVTGKSDLKAAWLSLISLNDVVGLKVYSGPGANSGTRPSVVAAVIQGLLQAGLPASNIIVWDKRLLDLRLANYSDLADRYHVRLAGSSDVGYDDKIYYNNPVLGTLVAGDHEFDLRGATSGSNSYVSTLLTTNITKIISIAPLLNHNYAGICGHLYSVSLGSVDNTMRFEFPPSRLAVAVPEIYALPCLGDHVVLNITDALICQYQGEQTSLLHYSTELDQIWFSRDPVALDTLGIAELDRERQARDIESHGDNPELYQNASLMERGTSDPAKIKVEVVK